MEEEKKPGWMQLLKSEKGRAHQKYPVWRKKSSRLGDFFCSGLLFPRLAVLLTAVTIIIRTGKTYYLHT